MCWPFTGAHRLTRCGVQPNELGVLAEAAAGEVDGGQVFLDGGACGLERALVRDDHRGGGAERAPRRARRAHEPPDVAAGGAGAGAGAGGAAGACGCGAGAGALWAGALGAAGDVGGALDGATADVAAA